MAKNQMKNSQIRWKMGSRTSIQMSEVFETSARATVLLYLKNMAVTGTTKLYKAWKTKFRSPVMSASTPLYDLNMYNTVNWSP
jgi:hypothetical protein